MDGPMRRNEHLSLIKNLISNIYYIVFFLHITRYGCIRTTAKTDVIFIPQ